MCTCLGIRTQDASPIPMVKTPSTNMPGTPGTPSIPASAAAASPVSTFDQQAVYAEQLAAISEFASFGTLFKSSTKPVELTESETEYVVHCVKHTFAKHLVFQFNCTNTLNDQLLENVYMIMQPDIDDCGLIKVADLPAEKLEYNVPGTIYVAFEREDEGDFPAGKKEFGSYVLFDTDGWFIVNFTNTLKFEVKDCDPTTGEADPEGYDDEYQVEDVEVMTSDYIRPTYISNFTEEWEPLGESEALDTFALDKDRAPSLKGKFQDEVFVVYNEIKCCFV